MALEVESTVGIGLRDAVSGASKRDTRADERETSCIQDSSGELGRPLGVSDETDP